jgi:hypothetical protein
MYRHTAGVYTVNETHSDNAHIKRGGKALFRRVCLWRQIAAA